MIGACVYMMVADAGQGHSFCKIGITRDLGKRIAQVQTGCPVPIAEVAYMPMPDSSRARLVEARMHCKLKEHHSHGEWFRLDLADPAHKAAFHEATRAALDRVCDLSEARWRKVNTTVARFASEALRLDEAA